eukprot:12350369-Prorocentrum_lima.AAC.1
MTSSLVGSEMCIRDRLQHVMVNGNAQQHQHMSQSYGGGNTLEMPAQEVCLLYTSDAADDM